MKREFEASKLYYGFPIFLLGYQDEQFGYNITTCSSTYSLGEMVVIGIGSQSNAAEQIRRFGAFTINVTTEAQMLPVEQAGFVSHRDKLALTGLAYTVDSDVNAPLLEASPVVLTCRVTQIVEEGGYTHFFATIVKRYADESLLDEKGHFDGRTFAPVIYMGDGYKRIYRHLQEGEEERILGSYLKANRPKRERRQRHKEEQE